MNRHLFFLLHAIGGVTAGNVILDVSAIQTAQSIFWLSFGYGLCCYNNNRIAKHRGEA